jgi:hypothetical protein
MAFNGHDQNDSKGGWSKITCKGCQITMTMVIGRNDFGLSVSGLSSIIISQHKDETTKPPEKGRCFGKFGQIVGYESVDVLRKLLLLKKYSFLKQISFT